MPSYLPVGNFILKEKGLEINLRYAHPRYYLCAIKPERHYPNTS